MAKVSIKQTVSCDCKDVWDILLAVDMYPTWRSDVEKVEVVSDQVFIEYAKGGIATTFTVRVKDACTRWEFDIDNKMIQGHWVGLLKDKRSHTELEFTEDITPKKWYMKPFVKSFLMKTQKQFMADLVAYIK
ncbi:polyketide cyclase/dehydrase/lipid transport protein [Breznakia blatticola]|uniref:Polyketide cyclase/dehydrase/lipid transport protein n=1 Tax=Breznakia blatticola TaxID=1754012 RepID=A0A4R7ZRR0_9FIRM|nr:SRPBCC family protein [Breznakia blatticola]TDW20176.1 polyketide cyclase/dehydrase/lipid transport protein [Breznakia blatticola]